MEWGDRKAKADLHQDVEQAGPRGIHQQARDAQLGTQEERRRAEKEGCALQIARDAGFDAAQALSAANAHFISLTDTFAIKFRSKGAQRDFAMIAGAQRFFDARLAVGE